jgi:ABC-type transport system substrate-binding protein
VTVQIIGPSGEPVAEYIQAQLGKVGLRSQIVQLSPAVTLQMCSRPQPQPALCPVVWSADFPDPGSLLGTLLHGSGNRTPGPGDNLFGLRAPAIEAAIGRAQREVEGPARAEAWARLDRLLTALAVAVPISWTPGIAVQSRDLAVALTPDGAIDPAQTMPR